MVYGGALDMLTLMFALKFRSWLLLMPRLKRR